VTLHIAGHDGTDRGDDAVALATQLAALYDAGVLALHVIRLPPVRDRHLQPVIDGLEHDAGVVLERALRLMGNVRDASARATFASSPAAGLQQACSDEGAGLVVVGSTHRGAIGRVLAGSTAERLLTGSPCPVALAPRGFATRASRPEGVVAGYDGSDEAKVAVDVAIDLALRAGIGVRVVAVVEPPSAFLTPESIQFADDVERAARRHAESMAAEGAARAKHGITVRPEVAQGQPGPALVDAARGSDLLVIGSRRYGPMRGVLVGSAGHHLTRNATGPVLIVPRGVEIDRAGEMLGGAAVAS
jgi:nucleotide-binding universal stress UspA family protein